MPLTPSTGGKSRKPASMNNVPRKRVMTVARRTFDTLIIADAHYVERKKQIAGCKVRNTVYRNIIGLVAFIDKQPDYLVIEYQSGSKEKNAAA